MSIELLITATLTMITPPRVPAVRCFSFGTAAAEVTTAALAGQEGARLVELQLPLPADEPPVDIIGPCEELAWVHVASTFKECAAAKRHGAVTIWLNEQAAAAEGNLESTGFLGAAIINDFADALCAGPGALRDAVQEAQLAAAAKAAEEEARAEREHYADLADEAAMLSPRWDAKAALPTLNGEEATSIFAMPADDDGNGLDLFSGGAQRWVASGGEAQTPPPATPPPPPPSGAAAQQQKFCTECGAKLPQSAKFCSACGSPQE